MLPLVQLTSENPLICERFDTCRRAVDNRPVRAISAHSSLPPVEPMDCCEFCCCSRTLLLRRIDPAFNELLLLLLSLAKPLTAAKLPERESRGCCCC